MADWPVSSKPTMKANSSFGTENLLLWVGNRPPSCVPAYRSKAPVSSALSTVGRAGAQATPCCLGLQGSYWHLKARPHSTACLLLLLVGSTTEAIPNSSL